MSIHSHTDPERTDVILTMALIGKSTIAGGWAAVQIFSAEKFPTLVRNLGIASCAFGARIGGVVAPQIVSIVSFYISSSLTNPPTRILIWAIVWLGPCLCNVILDAAF